MYGYALVATARFEEAIESTATFMDLAAGYGLDFPLPYALLIRARALIGARRFGSAEEIIRRLERGPSTQPGAFLRANAAMCRARLYASLGNVGRAIEVLSLGADDALSVATRGEYVALQSVLLAASGELATHPDSRAHAQDEKRWLEAQALMAVACAIAALRSHRPVEAAAAYDEAMATEVLDAVVLGLRAAPALAVHIAESPARRERLSRLLVASSDTALAGRAGIHIARAARRRAVLSPREQEVHELIAEGLTNEEIAKLLYISLSTAKVHVCHILEKLGVRSRIEAARVWQAPEPPN